jgi:hypothetical protein
MYKTLGIAVVLLAAFAFMSGSRSADASPTTPIGPAIVAHGKLVNQTAPINTTTIFTPTHTGLFRLSIYMTCTKTGNSSNWFYNFNWSDDAGAENANVNGGSLIYIHSNYGPPSAYAFNDATYWPGSAVPFEAIAGVPVTYTVTQSGAPDGSAYSLYYVVERLE